MRRAYVGSSNNVKARWLQHIKQLVEGVHSNQRLQFAYNYYGPKAFRLDVLELVKEDGKEGLYRCEQYWMDLHDRVFNVRPAGDDTFIRWEYRQKLERRPETMTQRRGRSAPKKHLLKKLQRKQELRGENDGGQTR